MFPIPKKSAKNHSRVGALILVYALHMVFFQALMAAPGIGETKDFKPLFATTHKTPITHPHAYSHPAVSYYTMLVKQGIIGLRSTCTVAVPTEFTDLFIPYSNILTEQHLQLIPQVLSHIGDDHFKLFRVFRVFLI